MRKFLKILLLLGTLAALSPQAAAAPATTEQAMAERTIGKAQAPVTIIEYASLTCPACRAFHGDVLPKLKAAYLDTGKAKLVYRDFPLDGRAMVAAMVARCAPPERYFAFLDALYRGQRSWSEAPDVHKALSQLARLGGMSQDDYDACVKNQNLLQALNAARAKAETEFGIGRTPSFVVNGKKIERLSSFESFQQVLKPLVK